MPDAPAQPRLYPLFADLRGRSVLVVGGGTVARRKVEALLDTGAKIIVVAPALEPALAARAARKLIVHHPERFAPHHLQGAWLAIAATGDRTVNRAVSAAGDARQIWVNVVDDTVLTRFHVPARLVRGPLQIAISSGGGAPMLARLVRERLEAQFDPSFGLLAEFLARHRARIRARWPDLGERRRRLARLLAGPLQDLLRKRRPAGAERALENALGEQDAMPPAVRAPDAHGPGATGSVALVGAGPGDPGLLTLRALRVLNEADVIVHDRLVTDGVLELARLDAERIDVGKRVGDRCAQDRINALLAAHAQAGRRVVRLKGGDPFVFGRGGEELEFLRACGIDYEVVPGITAAFACAAYAGVPLTHRDCAQSVRLVTARCRASLDTLDWAALAQERQTLAVYMGVAMLERLRTQLIGHGRAASTPFALIENGTRAQQRVITGTLAELAERALAHAVQAPALLIVGEVAAFADTLHWFGSPPQGAAAPLPLANAA